LRIDISFGHDADYVLYWRFIGDQSPSTSVWMIPGTWQEDDEC